LVDLYLLFFFYTIYAHVLLHVDLRVYSLEVNYKSLPPLFNCNY
jgi:hypothetical protein